MKRHNKYLRARILAEPNGRGFIIFTTADRVRLISSCAANPISIRVRMSLLLFRTCYKNTPLQCSGYHILMHIDDPQKYTSWLHFEIVSLPLNRQIT